MSVCVRCATRASSTCATSRTKSNQGALDVCVLRGPKNPHSQLNDPYESKQAAQIDLRGPGCGALVCVVDEALGAPGAVVEHTPPIADADQAERASVAVTDPNAAVLTALEEQGESASSDRNPWHHVWNEYAKDIDERAKLERQQSDAKSLLRRNNHRNATENKRPGGKGGAYYKVPSQPAPTQIGMAGKVQVPPADVALDPEAPVGHWPERCKAALIAAHIHRVRWATSASCPSCPATHRCG